MVTYSTATLINGDHVFVQIERYLARKSTGIVAISASQKHELANIYNVCPEDKLEIIPLGLDLNKFLNNEEKRRISGSCTT